MMGRSLREKGSGLIVALGVLAILSIMATTFITLMRLDTRVAANYVDDLRCEMLAHGTLNYFKALLRDDLDRTWDKYENRDSGVGAVGWTWSSDGGTVATNIPGLKTPHYGTPICNDFWFNPPSLEWTDWGGLFTGEWDDAGVYQQTFAGGTSYSNGVVGRYYDTTHNREFDVWVGRTLAAWRNDGSGTIVHRGHPDHGDDIDFDGDGVAVPGKPYDGSGNSNGAFWNEERSVTTWYYDTGPFVLFSGQTYFYPGRTLTGEMATAGGPYWRWAAKCGVAHGSYLNLNMVGNLMGKNSNYLNNIGRLNLKGKRCVDEDTSQIDSDHLSRIQWKGYTGEYEYDKGGFPRFFNEVAYHPSQISLERLFKTNEYAGIVLAPWEVNSLNDVKVDRQKARDLIAYRLGGDLKPGDGSDRYNPGWRQDGATYYRMASPENPLGDDRFFGVNDVIEHDRSVDHPWTSAIAKYLTDEEWRKLRPYLTMWSTDTILRGKIWPTEGNRYPGDWRHINILKRVNINIIGARGPDGLPYEDAALKAKWEGKRVSEQNRLFYMLVAGMQAGYTPANPEEKACQFIASLCDMVDRDQKETFYRAPTGAAWALGVERHPVINEVGMFIRNANTAAYELAKFRFELCNPMENIPWIPDDREIIDVRDYRIKISSGVDSHVWRVGDLWLFRHDDFNTKQGKVTTIGAKGMYTYPHPNDEATWDRVLHIGWDEDVPPQITKEWVINGMEVALWKPLHDEAAANVPLAAGMVEMIDGVRCLCVDRTPLLRLMPTLEPGQGPGGSQSNFTGCYRRWDPMNAKIFGQPTDERSNLVWVPGWGLSTFTTMGKPNRGYPDGVPPKTYYANAPFSKYRHWRHFERNFKVVDGDLPSIGWLGELVLHNAATDGPLTWVHTKAQEPGTSADLNWVKERLANQLDTKAKFDLFRPFQKINVYNPNTSVCRTENLQMLDIFTVWDPSNDGIDNDGDGAVDDADTGRQPGDRYGPEIRVFGRMDLNLVDRAACRTAFPDSEYARGVVDRHAGFCPTLKYGRMHQRTGSGYGNWGPFETLGDLLRADPITYRPGTWLAGGGNAWQDGPQTLGESGFESFRCGPTWGYTDPKDWLGDDDGDGIFDEYDERDMLFTWISNYFTTRSNVFGVDLIVDVCEPPGYPDRDGDRRKLPVPVFRSRRSFAQKQVLGILDRSTCLRVNSDGTCEFTGPVEVRLLRFSDERRVH